MKVGLDQEEIQAHGWAVTVFDALALLGKARSRAGQIGAKPVSMQAPPPAKIISCSLYEVIMRKGSRARSAWLAIWADACSLGFEASPVIVLRAMKLAIGGKAAATEAQRMVSEKIEASLALQARALSGSLGTTALSTAAKTLDHYRQKVRAKW